jgi:CRP-like cAMP-binding protein
LFYFLKSGEATVLKAAAEGGDDTPETVNLLRPGDYFGEVTARKCVHNCRCLARSPSHLHIFS